MNLSRHLCRTRKVTSLRLTEVVVLPRTWTSTRTSLSAAEVTSLRLTEVVVPPYVDIHEDITLCCRFDTDGEKLYSVKWYKDELEFCSTQTARSSTQSSEVTSLRLTEVVVPPYVDIHEDITICCRFDTDGEKLYSVKWYKDELEFCSTQTARSSTQSSEVTSLRLNEVVVPPYVDIHEDITLCCRFDTDEVTSLRLTEVVVPPYVDIHEDITLCCRFDTDEVTSLRLTEVVVPPYVDIHEDITLCCRFDTDGEKLYSVKWYKDELEFFRYMPGNTPHTQIFPRPGIVLDETLSDKTSVTLTALSFNTSGTYRCEVSTEAPSFKTVFASNNLTVMVLPTSEPEIVGVQRRYYLGDHINTTCTSAWSHPAPSLSWYINGAKAEPTRLVQYPLVSSHGLFAQSLGLSFLPERRHFQGPYFALELRCRVTIDNLPPWERLVTPRLHVDLTNQKLSMVLSQASCRDSLLSTVTALSAAILATTT
ncbi:uncharacterized protein LOC124361217 [Homalodisca vitripennis]|uniref:uncharacterized protein LOC124361217 n=1 Tax=Homalodisca vitripennis TaxID=197043 RepID=UPI001EEAE26E|nr:uncharacterized protein LOC124361217 [Homalodisca vitripennis]